MRLFRLSPISVVASFLAVASAAQAQVAARSPRIGFAYPAGGQQGMTFKVKLGGQFLDGAAGVYVSGTGVTAKVLEHVKPMTPQQANKLREEMMELQQRRRDALGFGFVNPKKKAAAQPDSTEAAKPATPAKPARWTAEDEKRLREIREKLAGFVRRPMNPAIAETVTMEVTVAPDAEPGQRELRLGTSLGLTNPLVFQVGQLPEFLKKETPDTPPGEAAKKPMPKPKAAAKKAAAKAKSATPETETKITLPATVNGQILPGEVDRFRFTGRRGQRLVVVASARRLIPYLPDAVPGWFQAVLALYDARGNELAYAGGFRFDPDPVLFCELPSDGSYVIEIRDSVYRGREDFVYRIAAGELPLVTGIFPLGGRAGEQTTVELAGWNLPADKLVVDGRAKEPGVCPLSVRNGEHVSNSVPFAVDSLPEGLEKEPNNDPAHAQSVVLPIIVNGRIDQPGDNDVFRFEGRKGSEIVAEVHARRLGSPLDSYLKLTDAKGQQLAANDDYDDKAAGLETHHADSYLRVTLPADGVYYVHLSDSQRQGGPEYAYRLRISPPRPDFELRVVPSSITARAGSTVPISIYAVRRDGFAGDIALKLNKDAPAGFSLGGAWVPAGQDEARLTLTVAATGRDEPYTLRLDGRATIDGREVSHQAVPAEDMMQAFAYHHLVPAAQWRVAVVGRYFPKAALAIVSKTPVKIPAGGTVRIGVGGPARAMAPQLKFELNDPPEGITIKNVSSSLDGIEVVLASDAAKVKPGLKGNLIVSVFRSFPGVPAKKAAAAQRPVPMTTLPAIPFEIVAP